MSDDILQIPIQINRKVSMPTMRNEELKFVGENYTLQYFNPQKQHILNLTFEITNMRIKLYNKSNDSIHFEVLLVDLEEPKTETHMTWSMSSITYKIELNHQKEKFKFEIKKHDRGDISKEFKIFIDAFKNLQKPTNFAIQSQGSNLGSILEQEKRKMNVAAVNATSKIDSVDQLFKNFEELRDLFKYFQANKKDSGENDQIRQMLNSLGFSYKKCESDFENRKRGKLYQSNFPGNRKNNDPLPSGKPRDNFPDRSLHKIQHGQRSRTGFA